MTTEKRPPWAWHNERLNGMGEFRDHAIGIQRDLFKPVYIYRHVRVIPSGDPDMPWTFNGNEEDVLIIDMSTVIKQEIPFRIAEWVRRVHEYEALG